MTVNSNFAIYLDPLWCLTPREEEIVRVGMRAYTTKATAKVLKISPRTVEIHRANIADKLGVTGFHSAALVILYYNIELRETALKEYTSCTTSSAAKPSPRFVP